MVDRFPLARGLLAFVLLYLALSTALIDGQPRLLFGVLFWFVMFGWGLIELYIKQRLPDPYDPHAPDVVVAVRTKSLNGVKLGMDCDQCHHERLPLFAERHDERVVLLCQQCLARTL